MTIPVLRRVALATLVAVCGCGTTQETAAPVAESSPAPAPAPERSAAPVEPPTEAALDRAPAPPAAARLEVVAPADLPTTLRARRPTIEIVPQSCGRSIRAVEVTNERVCL
jgi:hypothetical protein